MDITRDGKVHALCGWFDITFGFPEGETVKFSTDPESKPTHWKQTAFVLEQALSVKKGIVALWSCFIRMKLG
jgi:protein arginine N-methyltransferase 3